MSNNIFQKTLLAKTISSIVSIPALPALALAATFSVSPALGAVVNLSASTGTDGAPTSGQDGTAAVTPVTTDNDTYNLTGGNNLVGGAGGSGFVSASSYAGDGGDGAAGIEVDGSGNQFNFSGDVTGGGGGTGGQGLNGSSKGGYAGSGANAIQLDGSTNTVEITGTVTGGAGGAGGFGGTQRSGANGAAAIGVNGSNNIITVDGGIIIGGAGGDKPHSTYATAGTGGVAAQINGSSNRLITNGTLSGGDPGTGSTAAANAVQISGSDNTLELQSGYSFSGDDVIVQSGSHTLALGGTVDTSFDTSTLVEFQPPADGATQFVGFSNLEKTGVSNWTLTGSRGDNGTTTITQGALTADAAALGNGNISNATSLTVNQGVDGVYTGVISGAGNLIKAGAGTLTVTGNNTYTGGTTISAGTLAIGNGGTSGAITGSIANNGAMKFSRSNALTYSDVISGTGSVTKAGTGTLTLTGINTYTGTTTVDNGILLLTDGASVGGSEVTVNSGTVLQSSSATIGALNNEGTVVIAADKTLVVSGNYSQANNGTFRTDINSDNSYGKLVVVGIATLPSDAKIDVNVANPNFSFSTSSMADIITAGTLNSDGTFEVTDNSVVFDFTARKDGNTVDLGLSPVYAIESSVIANRNNVAVGAARSLDVLAADFANSSSTGNTGMDEVISIIGGFTTEQQVSNAVSQTLPLLQGSSQQVALNAMGDVQAIVETRLAGATGLSSGDELGKGGNFWLKTIGSNIDLDDDGSISGLNADIYGIVLGVDSQFNDKTNLGLAFSYADADIDGNSKVARQNAEVDSFQLTAYGDYQLSAATELTAQVAYGINQSDGERRIAFTSTTAKSDYDSQSYHLGVGVSHRVWINEKFELVPSAYLAYNRIDDDSYTETGAGALNLHVNSRRTEELIARMGSKFNYHLNASTKFIFGLSVGYDVMNDGNAVVSSFAGSADSSFYTVGMDLDRWVYNAALGLQYQTDAGTEITVRYDAQDRDNAFMQTASFRVNWVF